MKNLGKIAFAIGVLSSTSPSADTQSGIEYLGTGNKYDRKLEAAAIKRVARKIGDLRGSIEGIKRSFVITEEDLENEGDPKIGFPRVNESKKNQEETIPIV